MVWLLIPGGLLALVAGGELLVRGASRLARSLGIPPLVVGLTVVAFGTSAPEFAVSAKAALAGEPEIALGNVVGSNVFNVLVVLGLSAALAPLAVSSRVVRREVPLMIAVSGLAFLLAADGSVGRVEGAVLFAGLLGWTALTVVAGLREESAPRETPEAPAGNRAVSALLVALGLALLALGAGWLVEGAASLARRLGVGELVVGLTIVAGGTSLPELAASAVAALHRERDLAVGNVVGSNVFNLLGVLGGAAALSGEGIAVPAVCLRQDLPVMTGAALLCLPFFLTGRRLSRLEGLVFLAGWAAYTAWLVLRS